MKQKFEITGMSCSACSAAVEKAVAALDGVTELSVSLTQGLLLCEYDDSRLSDGDIVKAIEHAGYGASLYERGKVKKEEKYTDMRLRLLLSLVCMVLLMYVAMGHMLNLPLPTFLHMHEHPILFVAVQLLLAAPVLWVNRKFFIVGYKALWHRSPNMDSLVAIGSTSAMLYGIFALVMIVIGVKNGDHALIERYVTNLYIESAAMILTLSRSVSS